MFMWANGLQCIVQAVEPSIPTQSTTQLDQPEVIDVLLIVSNQDTSALRQPRECPLHHPPPGFVSFGSVTRLVPRRSAGCVGYTWHRPPPADPSGCHTPCPDSSVAGAWPWVGAASPRWPRSSPAASCSRGRSRPRWPAPTAHPRLPPARTSSCPFSRDPSGFCPPFSPPNRALPSQPSAACHSFPLDAPKFVALADQNRPDLLHHAAGTPALKPVVDGALGSELAGQLVPLATGPHPEDDAVEDQPPVGV